MDARKLLPILIVALAAVACGARQGSGEYRPLGMPQDVTFVEGNPVWRGLVVGQATREEVAAALGPPEMAWASGDLEVWRYLPAGYERDMYDFGNYFRLFFRRGVLQVVTIEVWGVYYGDLKQELGAPEAYIEHKAQDNVAIFASKGVTAAVGRPPIYVDYLQHYTPMSLEEYLSGWGRFHPEELPWPSQVPERVDTLGFVPGQTRRSDVEVVLGPPDFEWADAVSRAKVVYYHVPGRGRDAFHRFDYQGDVLVWMNVRLWQEDYTIDSAIVRLGEVGTVARAFFYRDLIPPIQYYFWPERGIVLVASMEEASHPIEPRGTLPHYEGVDPTQRAVPNGADVVIAHVQFEPFPLDLSKCAEIARKIDEELPFVVPP